MSEQPLRVNFMSMPASPKVMFLNGPNANLYGLDRDGTYGSESFEGIQQSCLSHAETLGITLDFRQSNHEGILIDWIQEARLQHDALIINAAGLSYRSIPILDALLAFEGPIIEAHMSNIWKREPFRHHSMLSQAVNGVIAGLGVIGYRLALDTTAQLLTQHKG